MTRFGRPMSTTAPPRAPTSGRKLSSGAYPVRPFGREGPKVGTAQAGARRYTVPKSVK
jgi:hypothetical protein